MSFTGWENIHGWFHDADFRFYDWIASKFETGSSFVEVGAFHGRSALCMVDAIIRHNKKINFFNVDHFKGSTDLESEPSVINETMLEEYLKNINPWKDYIQTIHLSSEEASKLFYDNELDFIFIDGSHEYEDVKNDLACWHNKIKDEGIISGHDWNFTEGVKPAVEEFAHEHKYTINLEYHNVPILGDCWYIYKR